MAGPKKVTKSAVTGKFVPKDATKRPDKTVTQTTGQGNHPERNRDAGTGRFVSSKYAEKHPNTTIKEGGR
jgi:hypothetical protein